MDDTSLGAKADPFKVARKRGITLRPRQREGAMLRGTDLYYDAGATLLQQRAMIGRVLLERGLRRPSSRPARGAA